MNWDWVFSVPRLVFFLPVVSLFLGLVVFWIVFSSQLKMYPLGMTVTYSYWKSPLIVDFPIKDVDFPQLFLIPRGCILLCSVCSKALLSEYWQGLGTSMIFHVLPSLKWKHWVKLLNSVHFFSVQRVRACPPETSLDYFLNLKYTTWCCGTSDKKIDGFEHMASPKSNLLSFPH